MADRIVTFLAIVLGIALACDSIAEGQEPDKALDLARTCRVEADFRLEDCAAIYWVGAKLAARRNSDWHTVLMAYAATYKGRTDRARETAEWPWGDVPGETAATNRRWAKLRAFVLELLEGRHKSPCEGAVDWGGRMDAPKGKQVPAKCSVLTANTFYVHREKSDD